MAEASFWNTALLYIHRPNLINRRVVGAKLASCWQSDVTTGKTSLDSVLSTTNWNHTSTDQLQSTHSLSARSTNITSDDLLHFSGLIVILRKLYRKQSLKSLQAASAATYDNSSATPPVKDHEYDIVIVAPAENRFAIVSIDYDDHSHHVEANHDNGTPFVLGLAPESVLTTGSGSRLQLTYLFGHQDNYWHEHILKPKLERWLASYERPSNNENGESAFLRGSIQKISVEQYCETYNRLKAKYSTSLLQLWNNVEKTDPIKFIYEDIAIAAYLITLWQEEQRKHGLKRRQTFADVGCGNGLLVYLLNSEGYSGYGVDARRRHIWHHYQPSVPLIERTLDLFAEEQLPECDWLIGNHSDELTPWLLYLAATHSIQARVFLLPCCCYDFDGFKFQRVSEPNKSQYQCYLDYLENTAHDFGFHCFRDKLRIPSTKRICLVCYDRHYLAEGSAASLSDEQCARVAPLEAEWHTRRRRIVQRCLETRAAKRLRGKEPVRNCTQIDSTTRQRMLEKLTSALLSSDALTFPEAMHLFDNQMRSEMKQQCGGLQTFVRNHKHIFTISDFKIRFQSADGLRVKDASKSKTKACWFYQNHPQGCPLSNQECSFHH